MERSKKDVNILLKVRETQKDTHDGRRNENDENDTMHVIKSITRKKRFN